MRMRQYGDTHVRYVDVSSLVRWLCAMDMVVPAVILGSGRVLCSKPTVGRLVGWSGGCTDRNEYMVHKGCTLCNLLI